MTRTEQTFKKTLNFGAGQENRTPLTSLEGQDTTNMPIPQYLNYIDYFYKMQAAFIYIIIYLPKFITTDENCNTKTKFYSTIIVNNLSAV